MEKRIDKIKKEIELSGEVFVTDLSRKYDVTEETIPAVALKSSRTKDLLQEPLAVRCSTQ